MDKVTDCDDKHFVDLEVVDGKTNVTGKMHVLINPLYYNDLFLLVGYKVLGVVHCTSRGHKLQFPN